MIHRLAFVFGNVLPSEILSPLLRHRDQSSASNKLWTSRSLPDAQLAHRRLWFPNPASPTQSRDTPCSRDAIASTVRIPGPQLLFSQPGQCRSFHDPVDLRWKLAHRSQFQTRVIAAIPPKALLRHLAWWDG